MFPRADDKMTILKFGEIMFQYKIMKAVDIVVKTFDIQRRNYSVQKLGTFTMHLVIRNGGQDRFITRRKRWPVDVVKWWGGRGTRDEMNTIIRYLLEETSKYESNLTHFV